MHTCAACEPDLGSPALALPYLMGARQQGYPRLMKTCARHELVREVNVHGSILSHGIREGIQLDPVCL
jgi:hypothetical protein